MVGIDAAIAANRFGLGARPGDLQDIDRDPQGWLRAQLAAGVATPSPVERLVHSGTLMKQVQQLRLAQRQDDAGDGDAVGRLKMSIRNELAPAYLKQVAARVEVAVSSDQPFRERLVHFWSNHFAVSADKPATIALAGTLENEVIRPLATARFADLLVAVVRHPAMLAYLDNLWSVGPNSRAAGRASRHVSRDARPGLNENLAREILELHTLGVDGGYTQADVTELARVLTGWSLGGGRGRFASGTPGSFHFREAIHEPGARSVLGRRYPPGGEDQGEAVLRDLARQPATAQRIALKLARHFIADDPPPAAVTALERQFTRSDGDIAATCTALLDCDAAWSTPLAKYKSPNDYLLSALRALRQVPPRPEAAAAMFASLGQRIWTPGSPAGWPDTAVAWDGADALMKRIEWAQAVAGRIGERVEARALADAVLGPVLGAHTRAMLTQSQDAVQALALLFVSPEFMRR
ncbi:MAG: DUF1800 family protein [Gammaproteobacteria bacterium]